MAEETQNEIEPVEPVEVIDPVGVKEIKEEVKDTEAEPVVKGEETDSVKEAMELQKQLKQELEDLTNKTGNVKVRRTHDKKL